MECLSFFQGSNSAPTHRRFFPHSPEDGPANLAWPRSLPTLWRDSSLLGFALFLPLFSSLERNFSAMACFAFSGSSGVILSSVVWVERYIFLLPFREASPCRDRLPSLGAASVWKHASARHAYSSTVLCRKGFCPIFPVSVSLGGFCRKGCPMRSGNCLSVAFSFKTHCHRSADCLSFCIFEQEGLARRRLFFPCILLAIEGN